MHRQIDIVVTILLLTPLLGAALVSLKQRHKNLYRALLVAIPAINICVLMLSGASQQVHTIAGLLAFSLDHIAFVFLLLLNICWLMTLVYSFSFISNHFQEKAGRFYQYFSIALFLIAGTGMAANLFTVFVFYTLTIPVVLPLITLKADEQSKTAGRWYLLYTLGPTLLILLPTLCWMGHWLTPFSQLSMSAITTNPKVAAVILALLIVGMSKNCAAPFSRWLPLSSIAPTPVTALIHSVGAVHTGTITMLKIVAYIYGTELTTSLSQTFWHTGWLVYLCGGTALYTAYLAWKTHDLKRRFSYSTVGQISYVLTAIVIGTPMALQGALYHIVTHSVAKMTLFFVAGTYSSLFNTTDAPTIAKLAPRTRGLVFVTGLCGLSIAGFPMLAGYYSKDLMLLEELHRHHYAAVFFLLTGSIINFLYITPIIRAGFNRPDPQQQPVNKPIPVGMKLALAAGTTCVLLMSYFLRQLAIWTM